MKNNTNYISGSLEKVKYGKKVSAQLKALLPKYNYDVKDIINNKNNVWCRDFMPIKSHNEKLVQFKYQPIYI
jgi:hypothetical protein